MERETSYTNLPLDTIRKQALSIIADGGTIYQKWTCAGCDKRIMTDVPNTLYTKAKCEHCGALTDIAQTGCGYLLVARLG
jgi:hypothetical protein